jgi:hypothetical protein
MPPAQDGDVASRIHVRIERLRERRRGVAPAPEHSGAA